MEMGIFVIENTETKLNFRNIKKKIHFLVLVWLVGALYCKGLHLFKIESESIWQRKQGVCILYSFFVPCNLKDN